VLLLYRSQTIALFSGIRAHLHKAIGSVYAGTSEHINALHTFPADDKVFAPL
jgi:hypothetical protein